MIICGTGHRPTKLGGYGTEASVRLIRVAEAELFRIKPTRVISGMALGWDTALAQAAIKLNIPFSAYIPFKGQESMWPRKSQDEYHDLLVMASEYIIISEGGYSVEKMQIRNEAMVDACKLVLALWDGTSGGTANCLNYARMIGKPIINCHSVWLNDSALGSLAGSTL